MQTLMTIATSSDVNEQAKVSVVTRGDRPVAEQ